MRPPVNLGAGALNPLVEAYISAMSVQPSPARIDLLNQLITGLSGSGVWAVLDGLMLPAAHDTQAAFVNARRPSLATTVHGTFAFEQDRGMRGQSGNPYVNTGYNLRNGGGNWAAGSATLFVWINGAIADTEQETTPTHGTLTSDLVQFLPYRNADSIIARLNDSLSVSYSPDDSRLGFTIATRRSSSGVGSNIQHAKNGVNLSRNDSFSPTASTPPDTNLMLNASNVGGLRYNTNDRIAAIGWGGAMSDVQMLALYVHLNTYLTSIGAD